MAERLGQRATNALVQPASLTRIERHAMSSFETVDHRRIAGGLPGHQGRGADRVQHRS